MEHLYLLFYDNTLIGVFGSVETLKGGADLYLRHKYDVLPLHEDLDKLADIRDSAEIEICGVYFKVQNVVKNSYLA